MTKAFLISALLLAFLGCNPSDGHKQDATSFQPDKPAFTLYAPEIKDSFALFISLPEAPDTARYPVVYLLDANLYFDIMATTLHKYAAVGLVPPVILVGIGYKDLPTMDSLRNRDYTFPTALPEYEMTTSGGADKFVSFLKKQVIPEVDRRCKTDPAKRIFAGHSFGGYCVLYALLQGLSDHTFCHYIAASPALLYNDYYLLPQLKNVLLSKNDTQKESVFITFGGLEEEEGDSLTLNALSNQLTSMFSGKQHNIDRFKCEIYSNLDHMDTPLPSFIKGIQWALGEEQ